MKSEINNYSELLVAELRSGTEVSLVISKIKELLKRRRHETILRAVLEKSARIIKESQDYAAPVLVVASKTEAQKHVGKNRKHEPQVIVDPAMIGGYILRENYQMTDQSYRTKLVDWYRKATAGN